MELAGTDYRVNVRLVLVDSLEGGICEMPTGYELSGKNSKEKNELSA